VTPIDDRFQEYFAALDRAAGADHCYLCRRTSKEVKAFFGFQEDGTPLHASELGLEDVALKDADIMSYRGVRPVCAVCQLNCDALFMLGEHAVLAQLLSEMENRREHLWPLEGK
jgi:hypothetical protein